MEMRVVRSIGDLLGSLVPYNPDAAGSLWSAQQVPATERALLRSSDSATASPRSAIAVIVPTRQIDHVRVAVCPGASPGIVKVPIGVTLTTNGPAAAVPTLATANPLLESAETTRSGSGGGGGPAIV